MLNWEALYQAGDTGWDRGNSSPALKHWLDAGVLHCKQRVLIPGCGRGHEVVALAKLGFDVTALDLAPSAIKAIRETLQKLGLKATLVCADLFNFQTEQAFDVIYEQTCLCALPPEKRANYALCLHDWLKPDGRLCLLMMQTGEEGGPPFHCDYLDLHRLFDAKNWHWQPDIPFVIPRPKTSQRFELGFVLHCTKNSP